MGSIDKWVQETYAPVVLTCTTPEVERLAQKNNLAFADLLNGFGFIKNADTPLRSVTHSTTLTDFNVRFLAASQFAPLPLQDSMHLLNEVVMRNPPSSLSASSTGMNGAPPPGTGVIDLDIPTIQNVDDVSVFLRVIGAANNTEPLPWYREFKRTLMDTFRCEEYSMMSQPAAMLLVVSSTESNPRASFEYLGAQQNLPSVFAQGLYDSNLPKFYLVVHDVVETEGTSIDPEAILRNLQVPPHAGAVLYFNSLAVDAPTAANVQLWTRHPFVRSPLFPDVNNGNYPYLSEHYGAFQSSEDLGRLDAFVRDFGLRFVLPTLESRIFQLNEVVSAKKKGVKNVFKSWLRKPIDLSARNQPNNNSSVTYRADSIQAQIRLLADTSFLVRDYELALEMYRLVRDDYKSDTSLLHCANTNEMIALCLLLTKGSPVQMTNALEAATATYDKTMNPTTCRLAVRAAVIAGEIYVTLSHSGLFTDYMDNASAALIRGSTKEQGICSAVLMERAAMCDLQARLPKFRKFGFRMVIAGHVYDSSGHSAHSARCYSLTRAVYDCSGWFHIEDHINFTLAQQSNRLNDPMASINLFLKLIGTGRSSASQQENLLSQFRSIVKEFLLSGGVSGGPLSRSSLVSVKQVGASTKKLVIRDLCMPELDDKSTVVFAPVNATGINRDIDGNEAEREVWKELEKLLENQLVIHRQATTPGALSAPKEGQIAESNRWLAPIQAFNLPYRGKRGVANLKPRQYAIGEKIYVEFEMKNALSCAVEVENIHLFGKFEVKGGATFDVPSSDSFETNQDERIAVDSVSLQLLPVSEERVRLAVCPKVPGILRITGVRWSICGGDVLGEHAFHIPGLLLQDTRANKEARARAPNVTLIADVVGHMPWLGVTIEPANPSSETFMGEIVRFNVSLSNAGSANLGHLQLCCSDLLLCVSTGEPSGDGPPTYANYIGASGQVVDLSRVTLRPGERRNITVWAKANQAGKLQPHILFKYKRLVEGEDPERALARTVKAKVDLNVLPCVDVSYSIEPSYSFSGEYILALTVTNRKPRRQQIEDPLFSPSATIQLENLVSISESWTILPFTSTSTKSPSVRTAELLDAQETSTLYFRLRRRDRSVGEGMSTVSLSASSKEVSTHLPLHQMLCLDHALEMVRTSSAASNVGAGERPAGGGGIRSIQSVRRENKAQKSGADQAGQPQEDKLDPQPTTKDALLHSVDVDAHLILVWSSPKPSSSAVVVGQTNLTSVKVRAPLKSSTCPLTVTLQYADTVTLQSTPHAALSFAEVEVVMIVRNDSSLSSTPVDFTLELLHPEESKPISTSGAGKPLGPPLASNALLAPAPHFFWSGLTKKRVANFAPNASVAFTLKACFMTAGVYDLNRFRFAVSPSSLDDDESSSSMAPGVFMFPVEYLVYVQRSQDGHGQALHTATVPSLLEA